MQEELRREVGERSRLGIEQRERFDTGEGNVLRDLDTKTSQTGNEDVGGAHALHGLVAEHVQLPAVEGLVDLAIAARRLFELLNSCGRAVDLHAFLGCVSHPVDLLCKSRAGWSSSRRRTLSTAMVVTNTQPANDMLSRLNTLLNIEFTYSHDLFFLVWTFVRDRVSSLGRQRADRCKPGELSSGGRDCAGVCGVLSAVDGEKVQSKLVSLH